MVLGAFYRPFAWRNLSDSRLNTVSSFPLPDASGEQGGSVTVDSAGKVVSRWHPTVVAG